MMQPEQNAAADRAAALVLGAALAGAEPLTDLVLAVRATDFRQPADALVWQACVDLYDRGLPCDTVTVFDELIARKTLEAAGGAARVGELGELSWASANAGYHASQLREQSLLRALCQAGAEIMRCAQNPDGPAQEVLAQAERRIFALAEQGVGGQAVPVSLVVREVFDAIQRRAELARNGQTVEGVPTGIGPLDQLTGGLRAGSFVVLAARPSVGKTAIAAHVAVSAAAAKPVLFCSLEQSREELVERMLARASGVNLQYLRKGELREQDFLALSEAGGQLSPVALSFDDAPAQGVLRIAANARRIKGRTGLGLVVIDYLQLIEPDDRRAPRHEQVAAISRRLKALARELGVPVLALAQLNRKSEERTDGKPRLSDLRESGQLEQDADLVILLHRPRDEPQALEFDLAKHRNGPTGEFSVRFDRARMRVEEEAGTPWG